jgi:hypothetical protein
VAKDPYSFAAKEDLKTEQLGDLKIHFARTMEELAQLTLLPAG